MTIQVNVISEDEWRNSGATKSNSMTLQAVLNLDSRLVFDSKRLVVGLTNTPVGTPFRVLITRGMFQDRLRQLILEAVEALNDFTQAFYGVGELHISIVIGDAHDSFQD